MVKHVIFHGHFYQPPRENPWTGLIPYQESAAPFSNWNEKIFSQCYKANSASRYLNAGRQVIKINNNYEYLSFNFGPTLLNWIKEFHPHTYQAILEADKKSCEKFDGHGNAIAQVYNHMIMPLASDEDKRIQIEWGIADFEQHFKRKPEGMWLAETAVDYRTVDLLIEYGIHFIILSPWQCLSIQLEGNLKWKQITNPQEVCGKAYKLEGTKGDSLAVFFYDHILAQGISFEHYLQNADKLYATLLEKASRTDSPLIHCATDGEVYGHHEPYGDMCYSALIEKISEGQSLVLDNYGHFLTLHPPKEYAKIKLGEKNLGSSWSCYHGVSRWYKDCGCNTGNQEGWTQKWRKPLRDSFDFLSKEIALLFEKEMQKLTNFDSKTILMNYIDVLTQKTTHLQFAKKYGISESQKVKRFYELLEARKFCLYMYTSCGWFFSELSGLEPTQNIAYALRAIELISEKSKENKLKELFLGELEKAESNIPHKGNGKNIALEVLKWYEKDEFNIASIFIAELIAKSDTIVGVNSNISGKRAINIKLDEKRGDFTFHHITYEYPFSHAHGKIVFEDTTTCTLYQFQYDVDYIYEEDILFHFVTKDKKKIELKGKQIAIDPDIQKRMLLKLLADWHHDDENFNRVLILLEDMSEGSPGFNEDLLAFYKRLLNLRISRMIMDCSTDLKAIKKILVYLPNLFEALHKKNFPMDELNRKFLEAIITNQCQLIKEENKVFDRCELTIELLKLIYKNKIDCDLADAQGILYQVLRNNFILPPPKNLYNAKEQKSLLLLAGFLNLNTAEILKTSYQ